MRETSSFRLDGTAEFLPDTACRSVWRSVPALVLRPAELVALRFAKLGPWCNGCAAMARVWTVRSESLAGGLRLSRRRHLVPHASHWFKEELMRTLYCYGGLEHDATEPPAKHSQICKRTTVARGDRDVNCLPSIARTAGWDSAGSVFEGS